MKIFKVFLVTLLALFVGCGEPSSPQEIAVAAIQASANGDVEKLSKYFGIDEIAKDEGEKTAYKGKLSMIAGEMQSKTAKKGGLKDVKVLETTDDGEFKKVKLNLIFGNGESKEERVVLKQLNGKWIVHK